MPANITSADVALPTYIESVYGEYYDVVILDSLVRNLGEEKAIKLLDHCAPHMEGNYEIDLKQHLLWVDPRYMKLYMNITDLRIRAVGLYKNDEGAARFLIEAEELSKLYHKTDEQVEQIWNDGDKIQFDAQTVKQHIDTNVYRICYYLAAIYTMPQRYAIVIELNRVLAEGVVEEHVTMESIFHVPPRSRRLYVINLVIQGCIEYVVNQDAVDRITNQSKVDQIRLLGKFH